MKKRRLLGPLALLVIGLAGTSAAGSQLDSLSSSVDALFSEWDRVHSPGAAVAVVQGGEITFAKGYGIANLEYGVPIEPSTIFHVASVSKQFTAFGVVLLAEQGALSLDDDIRKYLPEVPDFGETITIRHLIHHTSGLRDQWELLLLAGRRLDDVILKQDIFNLVRRQRELNFSPGTEHLYCNTGYTLLAEIIERVGQEPFPNWMDRYVFRPLQMSSTLFYDDHERIVPGRAYSFYPSGAGYKKSNLNYANAGATSLFTTVEDLAQWIANLETFDAGSPEAFEQMQMRGVLVNGDTLDYAFGLVVDRYRGLRRIHHSGGDAGYRSYMAYFPDHDFGVAVLSNLASFDPVMKAMQVSDIYLAGHLTEDGTRGRPRPTGVVQPSAEEVDRVTGHYRMAGSNVYRRVHAREGVLYYDRDGDGESLLVPIGEGRYHLPDGRSSATLTAEPGRPNRIRVHYDDATEIELEEYEPVRPNAVQLAEYAGRYYSDEVDAPLYLEVVYDRLVFRHRQFFVILRPREKDGFSGHFPSHISFQRNSDGEIQSMRVSTSRVRNLLFMRTD